MSKLKELQKKLLYKKNNIWEVISEKEKNSIYQFTDEYITFLNSVATPRQVIKNVKKMLDSENYFDISSEKKSNNIYEIVKDKSMVVTTIGKKRIQDGINILAAHIDSPCIDIKQNPLYECENVSLLKTHYYGGIKNYQWLSIPLALCGIVVKKDGTIIDVSIGMNQDEPVFIIPDLLPHLGRKAQFEKKVVDAFDANKMSLVFSSIPFVDDKEKKIKESIKLNAINILYQKYGIRERDLISSELILTPAIKARSAGIDSSMVAAWGQDDRLSVFCAVKSLLKQKKPLKTSVVLLVDREEIGSQGNTSASSPILKNFIRKILKLNRESYDSITVEQTINNSQIISADVSAAVNPNYLEVHDIQNATIMNCGIEISKFTGFGGKYMGNDASSIYLSKLISIFDSEKINWQISSLGKVDVGGGGTIAKYLANLGCDVVDCGIGLMGLHSLSELAGKADIYELFRAFDCFLRKA